MDIFEFYIYVDVEATLKAALNTFSMSVLCLCDQTAKCITIITDDYNPDDRRTISRARAVTFKMFNYVHATKTRAQRWLLTISVWAALDVRYKNDTLALE